MPRRPNILVFLIDDLDLERIPFYSRLDAGAAAQKSSQAEGYSCKHGSANCTYAAPSIEAIGAAGVRFLLLLVPAVGDEGERQGAVRDALRVVRNESHVCCAGAR